MIDNNKLYNRWKSLRSEAKEDCKAIDQTDLRKQDFDSVSKNIKWLNYLYEWKEAYIKVEIARANLWRELHEWYREEYNYRLERKDLILYVETDERYIETNEKCQIMKGIISYCEEVSDKIKQKGWEVKAFIDYTKFMEGRI